MQDPDLQPRYRTWAEAKWPHLAPVEEVRFDFGQHGPYSEATPDVDAYVSIEVKHGSVWHEFEELHLHNLLAELLRTEEGKP